MCEMRLEQFIDTQSSDQLLFIGSSSGFFFIGTPKEFKERHETVQEKIKRRYRYSAMDRKRDLEKLMTTVDVKDDPIEYAKALEARARDIREVQEKLERMNERLFNFQPLKDRIVRDYYHKELGGIAVIVDGQEEGRFWTKEEWDSVYKNI